MKINLYNLTEALSVTCRTIYCKSPHSLDLSGVCLYTTSPSGARSCSPVPSDACPCTSAPSGNCVDTPDSPCALEFSPDILYLVDAETAKELCRQDLHLIIAGDSFTDFSCVRSCSLVPCGVDLLALSFEIQRMFLSYQDWQEEIHTAILQRASLSDILTICARFLKNPVSLFDTRQNLLAYAGDRSGAARDSLVSYALEHGYSPEEPDIHDFVQLFLHERQPFYYRSKNQYHNCRRLIASVYAGETILGCLGMTDTLCPFTPGEYANMKMIQQFINTAVRYSTDQPFFTDNTSWWIRQLLKGNAVNANVITYNLARCRHKPKDPYCVWIFQQDTSGEDTLKPILYNIGALFQTEFVFYYDRQVVVLDYARMDLKNAGFSRQCRALLVSHSLRCGQSMVFTDIFSLHQAFLQSLIAIWNAGPETACTFQEALFPYIRHALLGENEAGGIVYPGLDRLTAADPEYGRELLRCLEAYILHGRNISSTAKALFLHRNTITYRLEQIRKYCPMELDRMSDEELFLVYLSCRLLQG